MQRCAACGGASGPSRSDTFVEGLAAHELHHHQQLVVVPVQLEERRDVGMIQARERDRFGAEALEDSSASLEVRLRTLIATSRSSVSSTAL